MTSTEHLPYLDLDPRRTGDGLGLLVVTVLELLRELLERQAIRRVEAGDLDEEQIERLGTALQLAARRLEDLRSTFADDLAGTDPGPTTTPTTQET